MFLYSFNFPISAPDFLGKSNKNRPGIQINTKTPLYIVYPRVGCWKVIRTTLLYSVGESLIWDHNINAATNRLQKKLDSQVKVLHRRNQEATLVKNKALSADSLCMSNPSKWKVYICAQKLSHVYAWFLIDKVELLHTNHNILVHYQITAKLFKAFLKA